MRRPRIAILGGGISGITTGIVLQMHGIQTKVYTHRRIDEVHPTDGSQRPPELASIHAAASILPHSAVADGIQELTRISQLAFHRLAFCSHFGVRVQRHYELYEFPKAFPNYAREVKDFTPLNADGSSWIRDRGIPKRKDAKGVWGWYFNAFFAEVPTYISNLYGLYDASGGDFELLDKEVKLSEFKNQACKFSPDVLIVCAGYGSPWVLGKSPDRRVEVTRGHMIKVHIHDVPHDIADRYFSYNYTPDQQVEKCRYSDEDVTSDGTVKPADVYFYPRSDGWLLGGSRQAGFVDLATGVWSPVGGGSREEYEARRPYFKRSKAWLEMIPNRIWDLNHELLLDITGVDISRYPSSSYIGYRFLTDPIIMQHDKEVSDEIGVPVYGNYGHGGSGYTLSWGCAWKLLELLEKQGLKSELTSYRDITQVAPVRRSATAVLTILEDLARQEKTKRDRPDFHKSLELQ